MVSSAQKGAEIVALRSRARHTEKLASLGEPVAKMIPKFADVQGGPSGCSSR